MNRNLWPLIVGFSIWLIAFGAIYGLQGLGCAWNWPETPHRLALIAAWLVTLAGLGASLALQMAGGRNAKMATIPQVGLVATIVAIGVTTLTFAPTLFLSICV